jgi:hypothetical protein
MTPNTRSLAWLRKTTTAPSALTIGAMDLPLPLPVPPALTLTSVVVAAVTSRTKMSVVVLLSSVARLLALLRKAMILPSALMEGESEAPLLSAPKWPRLTLVVLPIIRSRTKTS